MFKIDDFNNNNNNTLIYIAPACRMTSEALSGQHVEWTTKLKRLKIRTDLTDTPMRDRATVSVSYLLSDTSERAPP